MARYSKGVERGIQHHEDIQRINGRRETVRKEAIKELIREDISRHFLSLTFYVSIARLVNTIKLEQNEPCYTAPHEDPKTDGNKHSTSDGKDYVTHNYNDGSERYDPFPMGGNDKWMPDKGSSCNPYDTL